MEKPDLEAHLFEPPVRNVEKDRSRLIIIISGVAVFVVIGLIILQRMCAAQSNRIEMARAGSTEFDSYKELLVVSNVEKVTGERLTGSKYGRIKCRIQNAGERMVIGLELIASAVGYDNEEYRKRTVRVIPSEVTGRETLEPGEVMDVEINLEPIPDPVQIQDMIIVVAGLKVNSR
jgi:hypothetical protein